MTPLLKAILHIFDEYIFGSMRSDIDTAIAGDALHLAALGLVSYTEVLGGLRTGKLGLKNRGAPNFNAFLPYLGKEYVELQRRGINVYDQVRCGLVHNYFAKGDPAVRTRVPGQGYLPPQHFSRDDSANIMKARGPCGIVTSPGGDTQILTKVYRDHFFAGAIRFRDEILEEGESELARNFQKGLNQIEINIP